MPSLNSILHQQIDACALNRSVTDEAVIPDHLGNTRVLFSDANNDGTVTAPEILQQNHYYPFGMEMEGSWNSDAAEAQRYRYNGKELNEELGLYDYGLRNYDPAIGRWLHIDPLAEDYTPYSPYNYVLNSPINAIDPNGGYVYFTNMADARRTASEWNTIYGARYSGQAGASSAFYVAEVQEWTVSTDDDGNLVIDEIKGTGEYRIMANSEFDFNTDQYTSGLFDLISTKDYNIKGSYGTGSDLKEGYGMTHSSTEFAVYKGLPNSVPGKNVLANDFATVGGDNGGTAQHTAGGIALHELLYHISPQGNKDELLRNNEVRGLSATGPDAMRVHYGMRRTNPATKGAHGSGVSNIQFSKSEQERLQILRARTGGK